LKLGHNQSEFHAALLSEANVILALSLHVKQLKTHISLSHARSHNITYSQSENSIKTLASFQERLQQKITYQQLLHLLHLHLDS
jgi:hypothetical protein